MHSEETVLQPVLSNIVPISSHRKPRRQKVMEQMLQDIPEDKRELYEDSDVMRVILAFDHMDQEQAQRFYLQLLEPLFLW